MQNGSEIEHSEAFLHSGRVLHPGAEARQGRTTCAAKRSRALTSLGTRCDFAAMKECLSVRSLRVSGPGEHCGRMLEVLRGWRDHQDKFWQYVAADCGWQTCQPN
jgi:hypothetical protein